MIKFLDLQKINFQYSEELILKENRFATESGLKQLEIIGH